MSRKVIDVLIFIPLIPALPVLVTWFLPWERWLFDKIPSKILGPYILYCAFAAWHFGLPGWAVAISTLFGAILSGWAILKASSSDWE